MQSAEVIVSLLSKKAQNDENFVFQRLYRHLFNPDFYRMAYRHMREEGRMFEADVFNTAVVDAVIEKLKSETYYPQPLFQQNTSRVKSRLHPPLHDRLVEEAVRQLLEAIYEPRFLDTSHGFRPHRTCQTALCAFKASCPGTDWVIEGKIRCFFDHFDHDKLFSLLSERIDDGRFLRLIQRFLQAGYMQFGKASHSFITPFPGGMLFSLLANIYLHEWDQFMQNLSSQYTIGEQLRRKRECRQMISQQYPLFLQSIGSSSTRVRYTRFLDEFVVCILGSKQLAQTVQKEIQSFLRGALRLELHAEKSRIRNLADNRVRFLDYECKRQRAGSWNIHLLVPGDVIRERIRPFTKNGKPVHHNARIHLPLPKIIRLYNDEIQNLYDYYNLAADVSTKLGRFRYYHYTSLIKTIARKEKSSVKKVVNKYGIDVKRKQGTGTKKIIGVSIQTGDGEEQILTYFNEPLKKKDCPKARWVKSPGRN